MAPSSSNIATSLAISNDLGQDATVFMLRGCETAAEAKRVEQSGEDKRGAASREGGSNEGEGTIGDDAVEARFRCRR